MVTTIVNPTQVVDSTLSFAKVTTTLMTGCRHIVIDYDKTGEKQAGMKSSRSYRTTI